MVTREVIITCPVCQKDSISRQGIKNQKQIFRCENPDCPKKIFFGIVYEQRLGSTNPFAGITNDGQWQWCQSHCQSIGDISHYCYCNFEKPGKTDLADKL